jgi:KDO2-lipid IV(A) lauroyltransferase
MHSQAGAWERDKLARKNKAKVLMAWAARLDNGKGYELNVKPVNILSGTGRVEDDVALMNQAIEQLVLQRNS